jgi:hypothetical protein
MVEIVRLVMLFLVHLLLKNFHHIVIVTFTLLEEWCL